MTFVNDETLPRSVIASTKDSKTERVTFLSPSFCRLQLHAFEKNEVFVWSFETRKEGREGGTLDWANVLVFPFGWCLVLSEFAHELLIE